MSYQTVLTLLEFRKENVVELCWWKKTALFFLEKEEKVELCCFSCVRKDDESQ